MTLREGRPGRRLAALWAQWTAASLLAALIVTALTLIVFAGLNSWRPSQRVAVAPSLGLERAMPPVAAGRSADDARVLAR